MLKKISSRLYQSEPVQRCKLEECRAACCLHGVWIDRAEVKEILINASIIQPHLPPEHRNPDDWFDDRHEPDDHSLSGQVVHSSVLEDANHYGGTACIFLRPDYKCALQVAGEAAGFDPWHFKPFYCIVHPLDLDNNGNITLDETDLLLNEPASCLRRAPDPVPLAETFEPELRYLLGDKSYKQLRSSSGNNPIGSVPEEETKE
ncbi:MAG: hypothetical protein P4L50_16360 [Anaerolineaceae bacterium]|nr:hypothetical protein [Anaerolineaceae bacterium]